VAAKDLIISTEDSVIYVDGFSLPKGMTSEAIEALKLAIATWEHEQLTLALP